DCHAGWVFGQRPGAAVCAAGRSQAESAPTGRRTTMSSIEPLLPFRDFQPLHFRWEVSDDGRVATITLNRPERKNPLTFASYAELRDLFRRLRHADDVSAVVIHGAGDNFCSGGDVHEIIGPLIQLKAPELLMFTRMTGDLVVAMRTCPPPIVAAVAGAGAR